MEKLFPICFPLKDLKVPHVQTQLPFHLTPKSGHSRVLDSTLGQPLPQSTTGWLSAKLAPKIPSHVYHLVIT